MAHIDYFLFPLSPFTYLAGTRLEDIAKKHGATITYKPFSLMEVGKHTGFVPLPERHVSRIVYRDQEISRIAAHTGLPCNLKPAFWPTNPVPASTAIIAAQDAGGGDLGALTHGLMRACWAEDKNIAEDDVIAACLEAAGFAPDLASKGMLSGVQTLERNTHEALQRNVFGTPSYVVGEQVFWGQDRLDYLDAHLASL